MEKVRPVKEMNMPTNIQHFQTLSWFYSVSFEFLSNISDVSASLRQLLENTTNWHWGEEQ